MISCAALMGVETFALVPGMAVGFIVGLLFVLWDTGWRTQRDLSLVSRARKVTGLRDLQLQTGSPDAYGQGLYNGIVVANATFFNINADVLSLDSYLKAQKGAREK